MNMINVQLIGKVATVKQTKNGKLQLGLAFSRDGKDYWINVVTTKQIEAGDLVFVQGELVFGELNGKTTLTIFTDDVKVLKQKTNGN